MKTELQQTIVTIIGTVLGTILGTMMGFYLTELSWKNHRKIEHDEVLLNKKIEVLEKNVNIFSQTVAIKDIFKKYSTNSDIDAATKLAELNAEFNKCSILNKIYFNDQTNKTIDSSMNEIKKKREKVYWWDVTFNEYQGVIFALKKEIDYIRNEK